MTDEEIVARAICCSSSDNTSICWDEHNNTTCTAASNPTVLAKVRRVLAALSSAGRLVGAPDATDFCGADPFENGYTPAAVEKMYRDRLTAAQAENEKLKKELEKAEEWNRLRAQDIVTLGHLAGQTLDAQAENEKLRAALDAAAMYARARSECYGSSPMGTYVEGHKDASSILLTQIEALIAALSPPPLSPEKE